jgi:hypothetical protein
MRQAMPLHTFPTGRVCSGKIGGNGEVPHLALLKSAPTGRMHGLHRRKRRCGTIKQHKKPPMKNTLVIIAAVLAVGISGCAHKTPAPTCTDGKSCCAKKK